MSSPLNPKARKVGKRDDVTKVKMNKGATAKDVKQTLGEAMHDGLQKIEINGVEFDLSQQGKIDEMVAKVLRETEERNKNK